MAESLLSVGLDVGTTTTQLIVSRLTLKNRASAFSVPQMHIEDREILYRSPVYFTPLLDKDRVDGQGVRDIVEAEYKKAGIQKAMVDTGAVIITGETSRKENARQVLAALTDLAGDFVAATAGPDLESVLAAQGSGAVAYSKETGKAVLHIDIGGGTSNFAWIQNGEIIKTGCMNVGGRLIKLSDTGQIIYLSPVLAGLTEQKPGEYPAPGQLAAVAEILTQGLEMGAGLRPATELLDKLWTKECGQNWRPMDTSAPTEWTISFSGGVAECIRQDKHPGAFGDMGVELGQAIKNSRLCRGEYRVGDNAIRATVIGAGCHSAQLSGSTVFCRGVDLPLKNLPVASISDREQEDPALAGLIQQKVKQADGSPVVLAMPGFSGGYDRVSALAERIAASAGEGPVIVCLEADLAKALGQRLGLLLPGSPILCIDRVKLNTQSYLDVGRFAGPALPVVVKTLVWER